MVRKSSAIARKEAFEAQVAKEVEDLKEAPQEGTQEPEMVEITEFPFNSPAAPESFVAPEPELTPRQKMLKEKENQPKSD